MATRFAAEKGVEILLDALPQVLRQFPDAKVVFCGQYRQVWGEQDYYARLEPLITRFQRAGHFEFLGVVDQQDLVAFYANLNVLVVPSLNSTEAFGLVQIEAMQNGCPVIASDLPGVRQPVAMTGLGRVIPAGNAAALAEAITDIIRQPPEPPEGLAATLAQFHPDSCARAYEAVFAEAITGAGT